MPHSERKIFHYLLHKDALSEFYLMMGIRNFGLSMISVFLAAYIYSLQNSIIDVIVFLLIHFITMTLVFPISAKLTSKIGTMHTILLSTPITVLFFYLLNSLSPLENFIPLLGIIFGISEGFFWMAFNEEFSFISKSKKIASELSSIKIMVTIAGVIGPFIGGLIILLTGFDYLFLIVILLLFAGTIPLLLSKEIKPKQKFTFSVKKIYSEMRNKMFIPFMAHGTVMVSINYLWPLFVFLIVTNYFEVGLLTLVSNIFYVLMLYLVVHKESTFIALGLLKNGATLFSLTLILRGLSINISQIFSMWILGGITFPLVEIPFESKVMQMSKKLNKLEFFVMREHALTFGRILMLIILFLLIDFGTITALTATISISGIIAMFFWKH